MSAHPGEARVRPKRILALDGGGIRGVFSLQILARIEELLRQKRGRPDLVLADEFDFFAGTSTGAIIAAFLAWGLPVRLDHARSSKQNLRSIEDLYITRGEQMFTKEAWLRRFKAMYSPEAITRFFQEFFCEDEQGNEPALLGSKRLRTKLLIVMRDASTGSPWPLCNNPDALYNQPGPECNLQIPLWKLLRASTAAPVFFPPQEIPIGNKRHMFVDGGITPYNNPALIAVLMATLPSYRLNWPATPEALQVVSVGTGMTLATLPPKLAQKIHMLDQFRFVIPALMGSIAWEQDLLCRVLGDCVHGAPLDSEIGALSGPCHLGLAGQKSFTYVRYDQVQKRGVASSLNTQEELPLGGSRSNPALAAMEGRLAGVDGPEDSAAVESLGSQMEIQLDDVSQIPELRRSGTQYALDHVRLEHLYPRAIEPEPQKAWRPCGCPEKSK